MSTFSTIEKLKSLPFQTKVWLPVLMTLAAWLAGMLVDIMEVDAAQYASMSRAMLDQESWLELYNRGLPYLDKPPLIFWATTLSFKLFGVSNFTFKLPSILFSLLAIVSTYGLARRFYSRETAWGAALILATCQAFFLMNQDVKTDMYLTAGIIFTVWQATEFRINRKWWNLLLAGMGIGIGMLAKGPLGLVAPALALGFDFLARRDWKGLFDWRWLGILPIVALMLWPMCIGLYRQFGREGLEFFFWTQSFGRITGESKWNNSADPFFLVHTFAWAFLPWTLPLLPGLWQKIKELFQSRFNLKKGETITLGGFFLLMLALSTSRFQLPHYIFVIAPFAAIITADWITRASKEGHKIAKIVSVSMLVISALLWLLLIGLISWVFPDAAVYLVIAVCIAVFIFVIISSKGILQKIILPAAFTIAGLNFVLNSHFYPELLSYQSLIPAVKKVEEMGFPKERFYGYGIGGYSWDFYGGQVIRSLPDWWAIETRIGIFEFMVLAHENVKTDFDRNKIPYELIEEYETYSVQRMSGKFLNPKTRSEATRKAYLLKIPRKVY